MDKKSHPLNDLCSLAYREAEAIVTEASGDGASRDDGKGCYVLMLPRKEKAWVGFGVQQVVRYRGDRFFIEEADGSVREVPSDDPLASLEQVLDTDANYFFMISIDLHRPGARCELPTMVWMRARAEISVSAVDATAYSAANDEPVSRKLADSLNTLIETGQTRQLEFPKDSPATDWVTEADDMFVDRLQTAVDALQDIDGKVIVARTYSTPLLPELDPYRLYEIYNHLEPCCAASHFFQMDDEIFSVGCTPENIFSLQNNVLDFDVVASTRGVSSDAEKDARWEQELRSDKKELKEHDMALGRYQQRLGELCKQGSVVMDHHHEIRKFRHVRHLYSHLYGELRDDISLFDLIRGSSPALSTYPDELIPVADDGVTPTRFYGGVVGRTASNFSDADVFLNLRSLFLAHDEITTRGGVGVVRESQPDQELIEVKNKLRCVMEAEALWKNESETKA